MARSTSLKYLFFRNISLALGVPLVLMSVLTVFTAYRNSSRQMVADTERISAIFSDVIRTSIRDSENHLKTLSELISSGAIEMEQLPTVLKQVRLSQGEFLDIRVLNRRGIVTAVSPKNTDALGKDMSNALPFKNVMESRKVTWSRAFISPAFGEAVASISVPHEGGVLMADYDFVKLRHSMVEVAPQKSMRIAVVDSAGTVLAHTDTARARQRAWDRRFEEYAALAGGDTRHKVMIVGNEEMLVTATPISATGWTLVAMQSMDAVMSPLVWMGLTYVAFALVLTLLGVFLAFRFSTQFFSYFQKLITNIRTVAGGEYELDLPQEDFEELEEVQDNFAKMSRQIRTREEQIEELNEELKLRLEETEAANRAKSEFLANMSHELRTPLNGALGMLQLLKGCDQDAEQAEYTDVAMSSCKNLTELINDILDLSRIEAGKLDIRSEPFDLNDLYTALRDIFWLTLEEKGVRLVMEKSPHIPQVLLGDPVRIKQVLFNLVGNAAKFTNSGMIKIEVYPLPPVHEGTYRVLFRVSDTGMGIAEDKLETIFEPFTQVEGAYSRQFGGAGLGLNIVKRLVGLMGGNVAIDSTPGKGTSVYFCLTLGEPPEELLPGAEDRGALADEDLDGLRVLLAEDERVNRQMVQRMLAKQGCEVTGVEDGLQALQALKENDFDVVLMDVQMPTMGGVEAVRAVRAGGVGDKDVPIIAITAYAMAGDREVFLQEGFDDYLSKPIDFGDLVEVIHKNRR